MTVGKIISARSGIFFGEQSCNRSFRNWSLWLRSWWRVFLQLWRRCHGNLRRLCTLSSSGGNIRRLLSIQIRNLNPNAIDNDTSRKHILWLAWRSGIHVVRTAWMMAWSKRAQRIALIGATTWYVLKTCMNAYSRLYFFIAARTFVAHI